MILEKIFSARATSGNAVRPTFLGPTRSIAGVPVTEDQALSYSPVFAAVKVISETVAMLPWRVFRVNGESRELQASMRLDQVLHRKPNSEMTAFVFREYIVSCALLWGNGYAEIERNGAGEVVNLWPLHPSQVEPVRNQNGALEYKVTSSNGTSPVYLPSRQMFHLRGPTMDGIVGRSIISLARESIGLGIAAEQFGAGFFGNGGFPGVVIQQGSEAAELSKEGAANMLASFDRRHKGARNTGKSAYLEKGFEVKKIGLPHKDAQFIETRKLQVTDVARWFRLPPHKIADMEKSTFSNIEQQSIDFVMDSIQPWTERLEQEGDIKLHARSDVVTKINLNGLLRGDSSARGEFYTKLFGIGVYSVNDIRRLEDLNPVESGDQRFVPLNMVTLDRANQAGRTDEPGMVRGVLVDVHQRMLTKEFKAVQRASDSGKDMQAWARDFYPRHKSQLVDALISGATAAAQFLEVDADRITSLVESHCDRYIEASLVDVASDNWDSWENRAGVAADSLLGRLAGAA